MEKELMAEFIASYFYKKGHQDAKLGLLEAVSHKEISDTLKECLEAYKEELEELRKDNPHHHSNRID